MNARAYYIYKGGVTHPHAQSAPYQMQRVNVLQYEVKLKHLRLPWDMPARPRVVVSDEHH